MKSRQFKAIIKKAGLTKAFNNVSSEELVDILKQNGLQATGDKVRDFMLLCDREITADIWKHAKKLY